MLEKDIENLIVKYPKEFFPKSNFTLIGQQYKLGTCRADIVFQDKFERYIIIEVKRGILSRDASGQVMEYYGRLKQEKPEAIIEVILCANTIPPERRTFLENVGIECKEVSISLITQIAEKYNYQFLDDIKETKQKETADLKKISTDISKIKKDNLNNIWIFQGNPKIYDVLNALSDESIGDNIHWYVGQHKKEIQKGHIGLIWMSGKESGIYAVTLITSNPDYMIENSEEHKYWISDNKGEKKLLRVKMSIIKRLLNKPIFRNELKNIEGLKNMRILRSAQGTNFPVTNSEWQIISDLIYKQQ